MSFLYFIIPGLSIALSRWLTIKAVKRGANKKKAVEKAQKKALENFALKKLEEKEAGQS